MKPSRQGRQAHAQREAGGGGARGRRPGVSPEQRLEQESGASRLVSGGRNAKQGIANRNAGEEPARQARVVPIRNQGTRKRRAS